MTGIVHLGQQVHATDGPCGEIADIIIDPIEAAVTHVVIEPHHQHHQARLVPISVLRSNESNRLSVALAKAQVRALPAVCNDDFVHPGGHLHIGGEWDVGIESVSALPYWDAKTAFPPPLWTKIRLDTWDRIPKGECEIRRRSLVTTSDDKTVGHVEGFAADGGHLIAIIAKPSLRFGRLPIAVPMSAIKRIRTDRIELNLDRRQFSRLESVRPAAGVEPGLWQDHVQSLKSGLTQRLKSIIARVTGNKIPHSTSKE